MEFVADKQFLRLSGNMLKSHYYRYVLTSNDKIVLHALWTSFLNKGTESYSKGLLINNSKQKTLRVKIGSITRATCNRSLQKLDRIGAIIKIRSKTKNNRYLIGFRTEGNDNLYLLYHLINKYEQLVAKKLYEHQEVRDINPYCLDSIIRDFIMENLNNLELFTEKIENKQNLFEVLFARNDCYRFKFSDLIVH